MVIQLEQLNQVLHKQNGVLFALPTIVHRSMYRGRNIVAKNSGEKDVDDRGYYPVEWWILSLTKAENPIPKENEGLTPIILPEGNFVLSELLSIEGVERAIFGDYRKVWPLTKILDIGGDNNEVVPSFCDCVEDRETPPIPCHIHNGYTIVEGGKLVQTQPGKLEAYFYPPLNLPPYSYLGKIDVFARFGLNPGVSKEDVAKALSEFGKSDTFYSLMPKYKVSPFEGWTIRTGVLHSPAPYVTFEIQYPQDDFHFASWVLGNRIPSEKIQEIRNQFQFRGIKDEMEWIEKLVEWDKNVHPLFEQLFKRPAKIIEQGEWGRRYQIFFDEFYGEGFEVEPLQEMKRDPDERPIAGIVWNGIGFLNGNEINQECIIQKEFIVVPFTPITIRNTGKTTLFIFTVFPLKSRA
eukprot:TRINITY_DN3003_c0_g1_i1.p1 TRINITY_DN3003_c0_g1~~TRINITY_DN3003_c0_g1_i1.p1  ORF type:complete len:407 (-),score=81.02 TRINITY_DN3003_c0_g1_i1:74-1294(-)